MKGMDVINAIEPSLYDLANLLHVLTDLTLDLGSDGDGRSPKDRVHALATACLNAANSLTADVEELSESSVEFAIEIPSDDDILAAYRVAKPLQKAAFLKILRIAHEDAERAKAAIFRAERAETAERRLTGELDKAHRELDLLKGVPCHA